MIDFYGKTTNTFISVCTIKQRILNVRMKYLQFARVAQQTINNGLHRKMR